MGDTAMCRISFTHRQNSDATVDSICGSCSLVVARVSVEADLEFLELRHQCQPFERRKSIRTVHLVFGYRAAPPMKIALPPLVGSLDRLVTVERQVGNSG